MTEAIEGFAGCLFTIEERDTIQHLMTIAKARAELAKKEQKVDLCDETACRYNREIMMRIKELEAINGTDLNSDEKRHLLSLKIMRKDKMKTIDDRRRSTEDPSRELHKAEHPWKREAISETDDSEEAKTKLLLRRMRALLNGITKKNWATEGHLNKICEQFAALEMPESAATQAAWLLMERAVVQEPGNCNLYVMFCREKVQQEYLKNSHLEGSNISPFRKALVEVAQQLFKTLLLEASNEIVVAGHTKVLNNDEFIVAKHLTIKFLCNLFVVGVVSEKIMMYCLGELVSAANRNPTDEEAVEFAACALYYTMRKLQDEPGGMDAVDNAFAVLHDIGNHPSVSVNSQCLLMFLLLCGGAGPETDHDWEIAQKCFQNFCRVQFRS